MAITVIGVDGASLPPGAASLLEEADLVVGGRRHLDRHAPGTARVIELGPLAPALAALATEPAHSAVVVLASGDPGFFGIVRALREGGLDLTVLPAPSSVQRLAGMIGRSWDDMTVVSAHGRALRLALNVCRARPAVAVLCGPGAGPAEIAASLHGWHRTLVVAEDLGGPDERLTMIGAPDLASARVTGRDWREPNLLFSLADEKAVPERGWFAGGEPLPPADGWALPEALFAHRDGMISKAEVRALALARLAPRLGTLVWDVGAGSGSVAVECARLGAAVIAIERDADQVERIRANATRHGVDVRLVPGTAPEALAGLPTPDAVFVGGGGPSVVEACAEVGARRVVVALAALDRFAGTRDVLREHGYRVDGCQLSASRLADLPNGTTRLAATNPVLMVWSEHEQG
ncbi:MAG TPA: precorrin-6y C5,15-methyltransferase (decarboxylating) subunit CbiE [Pseudonocardiaceae bacterium]